MSKVEHRMSNLDIRSKKGKCANQKAKSGNFVRKLFDANLNFGYQRVRNLKIKDTFLMSISKVNYLHLAIFFQNWYT